MSGVCQKPDVLAHALFHELLNFSWRRQQMDCPIGISEPERIVRKAECEAPHGSMEYPVEARLRFHMVLAVR